MKQKYLSTGMRIQGCLKKASSKNNNDRKGEASCLGSSKLLLVLVIGDLHVAVVGIGNSCSWAPTSTTTANQEKQ